MRSASILTLSNIPDYACPWREILTRLGCMFRLHTVKKETNGAFGGALFPEEDSSFSPNVILLDFEETPEELGRHIQAIRTRYPHLPLIVLINRDHAVPLRRAHDGPMICCLTKPVPPRRLRTALAKVLRDSHAVRFQEALIGNPLSLPRMETPLDLEALASGEDGLLSLVDESGHFRSLKELEQEIIRLAFHHYGGHISEIARRLEIGRSTLYRKLSSEQIAEGDLPPEAQEAWLQALRYNGRENTAA